MKFNLQLACSVIVLSLLSSVAHAEGCGDLCLPSLMLNTGGTIMFDPNTQTLTMTVPITGMVSARGHFTGDFGTITMTTGPLISGSVFTGSALFNGGTFTVTTNGEDFTPDGILYNGTFSTVRWREVKKTNSYVFVGLGSATSPFGFPGFVFGARMFQNSTLVDGTNQFSVDSGRTSVPEPGTLGMCGTGLGILAGIIRRRFRTRSACCNGLHM